MDQLVETELRPGDNGLAHGAEGKAQSVPNAMPYAPCAMPSAAEPLTIVGWLWRNEKSMTQYTIEHANIWARMLHRHLTIPHRFVVATDFPVSRWSEFDPLIEPLALWDDWRDLRANWGEQLPNCYVRLKAFSRQARDFFGARFVSIDLDCLALGNLDSLFDRPEDFMIFRRAQLTPRDMVNFYQGSMWMMNAGAREFIWSEFKGAESVQAAAKYLGTDQAWLRHRLSPDEAGWTDADGVYGFPRIRRKRQFEAAPPPNARLIFFYDKVKPWDFKSSTSPKTPRCQQCGAPVRVRAPWQLVAPIGKEAFAWVAKHYR